jgi:hypothetical protein
MNRNQLRVSASNFISRSTPSTPVALLLRLLLAVLVLLLLPSAGAVLARRR